MKHPLKVFIILTNIFLLFQNGMASSQQITAEFEGDDSAISSVVPVETLGELHQSVGSTTAAMSRISSQYDSDTLPFDVPTKRTPKIIIAQSSDQPAHTAKPDLDSLIKGIKKKLEEKMVGIAADAAIQGFFLGFELGMLIEKEGLWKSSRDGKILKKEFEESSPLIISDINHIDVLFDNLSGFLIEKMSK